MKCTEIDIRRLKDIFAPKIVVIPPGNPHRSLCRMPDGEIRFYGSTVLEGEKVRCYIRSENHGLDWQTVFAENPHELGPMIQSPYSGNWLTVLRARNYNIQSLPAIDDQPDGVYAIHSQQGPGSTEYSLVAICDLPFLEIRQPIPLRSRQRWLCTAHMWHEGALCPVVLRSDDDGNSWEWTVTKSVAPHEIHYPHKGLRWQQYSCEPTLLELGDSSLMMITRTSQDVHYIYYSYDAGKTWTSPVPSDCFHSTTTMPTLMRLNNGHILHFWCNTQPLPELDHDTQAEVDETVRKGVWEDVFTNRDACHAAISEDNGKTWCGFREVGLNEIRDHADYRTYMSSTTNDKSVHQFEALELPEGKILLFYGQASSSRRCVIFDPAWLYETGNSEDFQGGFAHLSTHVYVKSVSGGASRGLVGHCAWNRTYGALLIPDPEGSCREVLHCITPDDPRLFNNRQGITWNFPACRRGEVRLKVHIGGNGMRLSLTDRWFNPCDEYVGELTQLTTVVNRTMLPESPFWNDVVLSWELDLGTAILTVAGKQLDSIPVSRRISPAGFSYLHLQTTATEPEFEGFMVMNMEQTVY